MRRRLAHPFGHTVPPARMLSLLMGMAVLVMFYQRAKEPQFWRWMTNESRAENVADISEEEVPKNASPESKDNAAADKATSAKGNAENLVPGPNETDADELAKLRSNLKVVQDRQPLQPHEMPAYWQLLRWSRTRPFAELEKLARRDVPYSHLWEEPNLYRGQPVRLKLHVRRVLKYEAKENPLGLKTTYEIWGWTDDSRSFPFVVVVPEKPAGLPVGTDVEEDIVFVGYFLKWMRYTAFDTQKNSPLLVGRAKPVIRAVGAEKNGGWETAFLTLVGGVLLLSFLGWFALNGLRRPRSSIAAATTAAPEQLPENWMSGASAKDGAEPTPPSFDFIKPAPSISVDSPSSPPSTEPTPTASPTSASARAN